MISLKMIFLLAISFYFLDVILILWLSAKIDDDDINTFSLIVVTAPLLLAMLIILPIALIGILMIMGLEKLKLFRKNQRLS